MSDRVGDLADDKKNPRQPNFWVLSPEVCFRVGILFGILALLWSGCKLHKLYLLTGSFSFASAKFIVPILFWDLLLLGAVGWLLAKWLEQAKGIWLRIGQLFFYSIVLIGLFLSVVEHRFFTVTQTLISWDMLVYGVQQFWMLFDLISSQLNWTTLLFLALPLGILWLPRWMMRQEQVANWLEQQKERDWRPTRWWFAGIASWIVVWSVHPTVTAHELVPLQRNFLVHWLQGSLESYQQKDILPEGIELDRKKLLFDTQRLRFSPTPATKRPNIVLIVLESIRWRSTTMAKPSLQTTPFLASLAKRSLVVEDMSPVVPHTSKALAAIMCGIYPKVSMEVIEGEVGGIPARCLPSLLKPLGYQTAIFHPATLRFENYDQLSENIGFEWIRGMEHLQSKGFFRTNYFGYEDRIMIKPSLKWLDKMLPSKKPFFLAYHTLTSHHEYKTPPNFPMQTYSRTSSEHNQYLNALRYTDDFLEELFRGFRERGMMKNTIFMFVADHGEAFGEHNRYQHDNGMWQEILKIPMLLYAPFLWPKGGRIKGPRQQIDILPTIASLLKVNIEGGRVPGQDLLKPVSPQRRLMMSCWYERFCMAMRKGNHKYIYHYKKHPFEVYDLQKDPQEKVNLANKPAYKARVEKARAALIHWRSEVNKVYDAPDPYRLKDAVKNKRPLVQVQRRIKVGPWLEFVGYRLGKGGLRPDAPVDVTYVFKCLRPIPKHWQLFYHLQATKPHRFLNQDHSPVGGRYPVQQWKPGQYILDRHRFRLPVDMAAGGTVTLFIGLWHQKENRRAALSAISSRGLNRKERSERFIQMFLGKILPAKRMPDGRPPVAKPKNARFGKLLRFVGYNLHTPYPVVGGSLDCTMVFQALEEIPKEWKLFFHVEQIKPWYYMNAELLAKVPKPLSALKKGEYLEVRMQVLLDNKFFRSKAHVRIWTGVWAPGKSRQPIHCDDKDKCSDGKGRLSVLLQELDADP